MLEEERPLVDVRGEVRSGWAEPDEQGCERACRSGRRDRVHSEFRCGGFHLHQRMLPVCPSECRPGCGQTESPCGLEPTGIRASSRPLRVSSAYTSALWRPDSQRTRPSAETPPMSGLPPPGIRHLRTTFLVLKLTSEIVPSFRLATYSSRPSRLTTSP